MVRQPRKPGEPRDPIADLVSLRKGIRPQAMREAYVEPQGPETELRRYRDVLDVAVSLTSTLDLKAILDTIVDGIIRVSLCERGFVIVREADDNYAMFTGRSREGTAWDQASAQEISHTVVARVIETHAAFVGADIEKIDDLRVQESIIAHKIRSVVCMPLIDKQQLVGVIYADSSFVLPPFSDSDRAVLQVFSAQAAVAIARARQHGELLDHREILEEQNRQLRHRLGQHVNMAGMISRNKGMLRIFSELEKVAAGTSAVLIRGESGTGKELLATAIHSRSPRRDGPFVAFNSAALPATLVESTLFGHARGAFTGADRENKGYFEVADGGTIFLDEVGEMLPEVQAKLLRVLQQKEIERVGEQGRVRKVDVRVVAATNRDLLRAVRDGAFRDDLYYRLNVVEFEVPPLRERREDILPLAEYFLKRHAEENNQPVPALSREARALLLSHSYPGNVRELENMMEVGFLFQEGGVVNVDALERKLRSSTGAPAVDAATSGGSLRQLVERFEERVVRDALSRHQSNVSATAKALGLSRQMLHEKIKKYGIATREN